VGIIVIGIIVLTAALKGINGVLIASGIGLISGLGGYVLGRVNNKKSQVK